MASGQKYSPIVQKVRAASPGGQTWAVVCGELAREKSRACWTYKLLSPARELLPGWWWEGASAGGATGQSPPGAMSRQHGTRDQGGESLALPLLYQHKSTCDHWQE